MKAYKVLLGALCALLAFSAPAAAGRPQHLKADMFEDQNIATYSRPRVPSDTTHGADLFPQIPVLYNEDADLFDRQRQRAFRHVDPEMLHAHPMPMNYGPLFEDPN